MVITSSGTTVQPICTWGAVLLESIGSHRDRHFSRVPGVSKKVMKTRKQEACRTSVATTKNGQVAAIKSDKTTKHSPVTTTGTTTAPTSKPEVREINNTTKRNRSKSKHPWSIIRHGLQTAFGGGIYIDTMEFALENLHEAGVEAASLFDAKTGEVTEKGLEAIMAAVEEGWEKTVDLAADDNYGTVPELGHLLSDRAVFDCIWANLVERGYIKKPQAERQAVATKSD